MIFSKHVLALLICLFGSTVLAEDYIYKGEWHTTNRKLDGIQTAVIVPLPNDKWQGRFYGTWHGVDYDYTVTFSGKADNLSGTARIDGASYEWTGSINTALFKGTFTGSRYNGWFSMPRKRN